MNQPYAWKRRGQAGRHWARHLLGASAWERRGRFLVGLLLLIVAWLVVLGGCQIVVDPHQRARMITLAMLILILTQGISFVALHRLWLRRQIGVDAGRQGPGGEEHGAEASR